MASQVLHQQRTPGRRGRVMGSAIQLEIHPREGGADAAAFASELATSIAKHSGATMSHEGRVASFHRL